MANVILRTFISRSRHFTKVKYTSCYHTFSRISVLTPSYRNSHWNIETDKLLFIQSRCVVPFQYCTEKECKPPSKTETKLTLFQRLKSMYKDYWYVLVPVHVVTSVGWFGGFYYMAQSGVDVVALMESLNVNERIVNSLRDSSMGYFAIAYACYKIVTPARYTVTLGGTTISINFLKKWGYIKPVPSTDRLKKIYQEKKENIIYSMKGTKKGLKLKTDKLKEKIDDIEREISSEVKNTIKKKAAGYFKDSKKT